MTQLSVDTVLERIPEIDVRLISNGQVIVSAAGCTDLVGQQVILDILRFFNQPNTLKAFNTQFGSQANSTAAWITSMNTVQRLFQAGYLKTDDQREAYRQDSFTMFDKLDVHFQMLDDELRTQNWVAALKQVVTPDDIVVDIGTGTGILAMAAAKAGAKKVYAIEQGRIANLAENLIAANGLSDRIDVIRGRSTSVTLPERGTVLVSEIIGNAIFNEGILKTFLDAKQRLLQPNATFIPNSLDIYAVAVEFEEGFYRKRVFNEATLERWQDMYGLDFGSFPHSDAIQAYTVSPRHTNLWRNLSEPQHVTTVDFTQLTSTVSDIITTTLPVTKAGQLTGLVVYPVIHLAQGIVHSLQPKTIHKTNSWNIPLYGLPQGITLSEGDQLDLHTQYSGTQLSVLHLAKHI